MSAWNYAALFAEVAWNNTLHRGSTKTPWEQRHGEGERAPPLIPFGASVYFKPNKASKESKEAHPFRAKHEGVFCGYKLKVGSKTL